jgi:hypothetical protein
VPSPAPSITNGLQVLTDRQEAVRRHWERVHYLHDYFHSSLRLTK